MFPLKKWDFLDKNTRAWGLSGHKILQKFSICPWLQELEVSAILGKVSSLSPSTQQGLVWVQVPQRSGESAQVYSGPVEGEEEVQMKEKTVLPHSLHKPLSRHRSPSGASPGASLPGHPPAWGKLLHWTPGCSVAVPQLQVRHLLPAGESAVHSSVSHGGPGLATCRAGGRPVVDCAEKVVSAVPGKAQAWRENIRAWVRGLGLYWRGRDSPRNAVSLICGRVNPNVRNRGLIEIKTWDFSGGPLANAADMGSTPSLGRSHMLQGN